jgi:hypothetical protein
MKVWAVEIGEQHEGVSDFTLFASHSGALTYAKKELKRRRLQAKRMLAAGYGDKWQPRKAGVDVWLFGCDYLEIKEYAVHD